jgi:hypothetical protein
MGSITEQRVSSGNHRPAFVPFGRTGWAGHGVGRATAQLPLIIGRRTLCVLIGACWRRAGRFHRCHVKMVAMVRRVGNPSVPGGLAVHKFVAFPELKRVHLPIATHKVCPQKNRNFVFAKCAARGRSLSPFFLQIRSLRCNCISLCAPPRIRFGQSVLRLVHP